MIDLVERLLEESDPADPRVTIVREYLRLRGEAAAASDAADAEERERVAYHHGDVSAPTRPDDLYVRIGEALGELDRLRARSEQLAGALGACPACWGVDPACATCGGAGRPGGTRPDPALFRRFVVPVLERVRATSPQESDPRARETTTSDEDGTERRPL